MKISDLSRVEYRKINRKDHDVIRDLIFDVYGDTWEYKSEPKQDSSVPGRKYEASKMPKIMSGLYLDCLLGESEYIQTAYYREELVGVVFAANRKKAGMTGGIKSAASKLRLKQSAEGKRNLRYMQTLAGLQKQLADGTEESADCLILFLTVRKRYRRNGIGRQLLENLYEDFKQRGKEKIYLQADLRSNHDFLKKHGFTAASVKEEMVEHKNRRYREQLVLYKKEKETV